MCKEGESEEERKQQEKGKQAYHAARPSRPPLLASCRAGCNATSYAFAICYPSRSSALSPYQVSANKEI
jgi:hypothetical protein